MCSNIDLHGKSECRHVFTAEMDGPSLAPAFQWPPLRTGVLGVVPPVRACGEARDKRGRGRVRKEISELRGWNLLWGEGGCVPVRESAKRESAAWVRMAGHPRRRAWLVAGRSGAGTGRARGTLSGAGGTRLIPRSSVRPFQRRRQRDGIGCPGGAPGKSARCGVGPCGQRFLRRCLGGDVGSQSC